MRSIKLVTSVVADAVMRSKKAFEAELEEESEDKS
ncbi:hypothetical protein ES703_05329 [subsurface metagenome]